MKREEPTRELVLSLSKTKKLVLLLASWVSLSLTFLSSLLIEQHKVLIVNKTEMVVVDLVVVIEGEEVAMVIETEKVGVDLVVKEEVMVTETEEEETEEEETEEEEVAMVTVVVVVEVVETGIVQLPETEQY